MHSVRSASEVSRLPVHSSKDEEEARRREVQSVRSDVQVTSSDVQAES